MMTFGSKLPSNNNIQISNVQPHSNFIIPAPHHSDFLHSTHSPSPVVNHYTNMMPNSLHHNPPTTA